MLLGIIGYGRHIQIKLLPALEKVDNIDYQLVAIAKRTPSHQINNSGQYIIPVTNNDIIINNPHIDAVIIAIPSAAEQEKLTKHLIIISAEVLIVVYANP